MELNHWFNIWSPHGITSSSTMPSLRYKGESKITSWIVKLHVGCYTAPFHMNTPTNKSSYFPRIRSSPVDNVIPKILWKTIWSSENPPQPTALGYSYYLLALWLIPYVYYSSLISMVIAILIYWIIMCAGARNHSLIPMKSFFWLRRHPGHELVLGKSNLDWSTVKSYYSYSSFNHNVCFRSFILEVIIPL